MRLHGGRYSLLFPALVFAALTLFCVPEAQVHALRGWALSKLSPVLGISRLTRLNDAPPVALISFSSNEAKSPEAPPPAEDHSEELDHLKSELVSAYNQINHLKNALPASNINTKVKPPAGIQAGVIARRILWQEPILGLNRGETQGVKLHAGVLHRGAVVGRVVAAGAQASSMALLTHRGLSIGARLMDCRVEGVLQGGKDDGGERLCRMQIVARDLDAKVGEQVVTSGLDASFPPGLWLGVVTAIKKTGDVQWELSVRPACNENAIESVQVLTIEAPEVPWPAGSKRK